MTEGCKSGYNVNAWCRLCKGEWCCQRYACAYSPDDFEELSYNYFWKKIAEGRISIDHAFVEDQELGAFVPYHGSFILSLEKLHRRQGLLYLRARNLKSPIVDVAHVSNEPKTCINWLPDIGCSLSFEKRPTEGRLLEPRPFCDCIGHTTPRELAEEWYKVGMQEILFHLAREFSNSKLKEGA